MSCACTTTLSSCGCCEGVTAETPQTTLNRAGLSAIAYRVAAYPQFYETLLARIAQSGQPSLRALKSREPDDFTIALLDAFSVMGDVLTFYTERYGNESYLRTATQRQSVRELANLVGYRMSPGVAASVDLVIFDCDGVLVDSEVISCRAHAETLTRHGYPITADQVLERFLGLSDREARRVVEAEIGRRLPDNFESDILPAFTRFFTSQSGFGGMP